MSEPIWLYTWRHKLLCTLGRKHFIVGVLNADLELSHHWCLHCFKQWPVED